MKNNRTVKRGYLRDKIKYFLFLFILFTCTSSFAGEADVVKVAINKTAARSYDFSVTVLHKDSGWDHYVNKWDVIDEKGTVLATRILHHPHVNEQPFTRSLSGVVIPENINMVTVRAFDSVHAYGGKEKIVTLP